MWSFPVERAGKFTRQARPRWSCNPPYLPMKAPSITSPKKQIPSSIKTVVSLLFILIPSVALAAPEALSDSHAQTSHKDLIDKVHAASMARRQALQKQRVASDSVWPHKAVGDTRWALHCLYQNKRVAEANERIRARTDVDRPFKAIYFACADYMQILALFRKESPHYPGRLEASTEKLMKDKLFLWARDFERHWDGFRTETSPDLDPIWKVHASENHDLVRKGNNVLIFEILAEDPAYRDKMIMGRPVSWYAQWYNDYTKRWIRARAANGMWMEMGSGYIKYSCALFLNWSDLSSDPELRQLAKMYLDLIFIEEAQTAFKNGNRALTGNRIRTLNSIAGLSNVKGLFYGDPGSHGSHNSNYEVTSYQIPGLAILLREYGDEAEPFIITNRLPVETAAKVKYGPETSKPHGATAYIREDSQVFNYVYKTSDYSMGSHQSDIDSDPLDGIGDFSGISGQSHQTGILFNDSIPGGGRVMPFMDGGGRTYRYPYWTVQHKNLMVSQRTANGGTYVKRGMVYITPSLTKVEKDGWIFVDSGNAWAAVYPLGGYTWGPSTNPEKWAGDFVLPNNDHTPIIYFAGNAQDGYHSFAKFQQYVLNDIRIKHSSSKDTVVVTQAGEPEFTYYTDYRLPVVKDPDSLYSSSLPLTTAKSYKSPYLNTGSHPQEIIAEWKDYKRVYDFANAEIIEK